MNILIMGNSHVGALIKAYKDNPSGDVQFLAVDGNSLLQNLEIDEQCQLISTKRHITEAIADQGLENVSLNTFDFIFVYGCQLRAAGSGVHWINKVCSPTEGFSEQVLTQANKDFVEDTAHYRFIERISQWPLSAHVRVISMPSPLPNELAPFCENMNNVNQHNADTVQSAVESGITALGVEYLDTPNSLLTSNRVTTRSEFKASWKNDTAHLNTAGGHEVLQTIIAYTINTVWKLAA